MPMHKSMTVNKYMLFFFEFITCFGLAFYVSFYPPLWRDVINMQIYEILRRNTSFFFEFFCLLREALLGDAYAVVRSQASWRRGGYEDVRL